MNATLSLLLPMVLANPPMAPGCAQGCAPATPMSSPLMPFMRYPHPTMPRQTCPPLGPPAPVLAGRILAPDGVKVVLQPGPATGKIFATPITAGFRPGYRYVLELANLPGHPTERLYPVLEVVGSLVPRPGMKYMEFPAPILITKADIDRALGGTLVTKVIYLEDPTKAVPIEAKPDQPLEFTDITLDGAMDAARDNGRLVAILRMGDRKPEPDELARATVAGTILLPGQNTLPAPAAVATLPCMGVPLYDPIIGPKPTTEECLTDGGDKGAILGIGLGQRLGGLNPTDVALEYTMNGKRRVATSNEVCICSPRYVVRKVEVMPGGVQVAHSLDATTQVLSRVTASSNNAPMAAINRDKPLGFDSRVRPAIVVVREGVHTFISLSKVQGMATVSGVQVVVGTLEVDEITNIPDQIVVTKSVEPTGPVQAGEVVTFTIKYRNGTTKPATDLILSDSLSGRLSYIAGSAQTDRPANVTSVDNEAGSAVVRFEIPGPIAPGQSGMVKFKARVR